MCSFGTSGRKNFPSHGTDGSLKLLFVLLLSLISLQKCILFCQGCSQCDVAGNIGIGNVDASFAGGVLLWTVQTRDFIKGPRSFCGKSVPWKETNPGSYCKKVDYLVVFIWIETFCVGIEQTGSNTIKKCRSNNLNANAMSSFSCGLSFTLCVFKAVCIIVLPAAKA